MKLFLMTTVMALSLLVSIGAHAEQVVTQPQVIIKSKGSIEQSPAAPLLANPYGYNGVTGTTEEPRDRKETSTFTDANGVQYEIVRYIRYNNDGDQTIKTIVKSPDGRETELKSTTSYD